MSYKLCVKNFQSIKDQEFTFKGFVAVTGPSNLGKSSLVRAVSSVLYNEWDKSFRRNGVEDPTEVEFAHKGYSIRQCKSERVNTYQLTTASGSLEFDKVGKEVPEEVQDLGFKTFVAGSDTLNLTVAGQMDPLFVVNYPSSVNTKILNSVFKISKLERASGFVQTDIKTLKREHKDTIKEHRSLQKELTSLKSKKDSLESLFKTSKTLSVKVKSLDSYHSTLKDFKPLKKAYDANSKLLSNRECAQGVLKSLRDLDIYTKYTSSSAELDSELGVIESLLEFKDLNISNIKRYQRGSLIVDQISNFHILGVEKSRLESYIASRFKDSLLEDFIVKYKDLLGYFSAVKVLKKVSDHNERVGEALSIAQYLKDYTAYVLSCRTFLVAQEGMEDLKKGLEDALEKMAYLTSCLKICKECGQPLKSGERL